MLFLRPRPVEQNISNVCVASVSETVQCYDLSGCFISSRRPAGNVELTLHPLISLLQPQGIPTFANCHQTFAVLPDMGWYEVMGLLFCTFALSLTLLVEEGG
jgi:hypothetical protein